MKKCKMMMIKYSFCHMIPRKIYRSLRFPTKVRITSDQVYMHNFTIVKGNGKAKLTPENATAYCWTENEFPKDSNIISSCAYDFLKLTYMSSYQTCLRWMLWRK